MLDELLHLCIQHACTSTYDPVQFFSLTCLIASVNRFCKSVSNDIQRKYALLMASSLRHMAIPRMCIQSGSRTNRCTCEGPIDFYNRCALKWMRKDAMLPRHDMVTTRWSWTLSQAHAVVVENLS